MNENGKKREESPIFTVRFHYISNQTLKIIVFGIISLTVAVTVTVIPFSLKYNEIWLRVDIMLMHVSHTINIVNCLIKRLE